MGIAKKNVNFFFGLKWDVKKWKDKFFKIFGGKF